jgi:GTP-binding protein
MKDCIIAIIGRPNVGKSSLFNAILGHSDAITERSPGITRDRKYGSLIEEDLRLVFIDTGGYDTEETGIIQKIREQTLIAVTESDIVLFVVDGKTGLMPSDEDIAEILRRHNKPVIVIVNKVDTDEISSSVYEFNKLGFKNMLSTSAAHRKNIGSVIEEISSHSKKIVDLKKKMKPTNEDMNIAIVGQPNSGKSTLVNFLLGEKRMIISDIPGTTRDSVDSRIKYHGINITLIDTAGLRKKAKVNNKIEVYSILRTIKSVERSDIVFLIYDINRDLTTQDQKIGALIKSRQKCMVIVANKCDIYSNDKNRKRKEVQAELLKKFNFYPDANFELISAKSGYNVNKLIDSAFLLFQKYRTKIPTPKLNRAIQNIMNANFPQSAKNFKIYYGVQTDNRPPTFKLFVNSKKMVDKQLIRFLEKQLIKNLVLRGIPIRIDLVERR